VWAAADVTRRGRRRGARRHVELECSAGRTYTESGVPGIPCGLPPGLSTGCGWDADVDRDLDLPGLFFVVLQTFRSRCDLHLTSILCADGVRQEIRKQNCQNKDAF